MSTDEGRELMKDMGVVVPSKEVAVAPVARVDIATLTKEMEQRIALVDRIHTIIQKQINPEVDIKNIGGKFRRTINFARKCFRIVGGSIEWTTYPNGLKYLRESMQDEQGSWFAISVACTYITPWGERVEAFKRLTSREPFFGIEGNDFKDAADVNESDIVEMAVTEAFKTAVFVALGLPKDISPDELGKFGVNGAKAAGHSFDGAKGAQGGSQDTNQESYDRRKKIEACCKRLAESGYAHNGVACPTAVDVLRAVTANPGKGWNGWGNFKAVKENQLPKILEQLEKIENEVNPFGGGGQGEQG